MTVLVLRADAGTRRGSGHVMRALALGQAWQDEGGEALLLTADAGDGLRERFESEGIAVETLEARPGGRADGAATAAAARRARASWVAADGYHLTAPFQRASREQGARLLLIDDYGPDRRCHADLILNQNVCSSPGAGRRRAAGLLLGPRYALLRREFAARTNRPRSTSRSIRKVLVTMGGADPDNRTGSMVRALAAVLGDKVEVTVVAGALYAGPDPLAAAPAAFRLRRSVRNMAPLIARSDLALSAAGTTAWELAFLGVPAILTVLADNQRRVADCLRQRGAAVLLAGRKGRLAGEVAEAVEQLAPPAARKEMSLCGRRLVDGAGARRVVWRLLGGDLRLREAGPGDCDLLWRWANDREARQASFNSEPIPLGSHREWYARTLDDRRCIIYLVSREDGPPLAAVRYECEGREAVVSVVVEKDSRGKGYGKMIIDRACGELFDRTDVREVHAYVKKRNAPSVRAFMAAGFEEREEVRRGRSRALHLALRKERGWRGGKKARRSAGKRLSGGKG